jgi:FkbM family methyltransferase
MYEDATMRVLRRVLRRGMGFLDIGANLGLHTTIAAHLVGESGRVLAVEPQEDMCELIRLNASQNGLSNISIVQAAVGRVAGDATLHQLYDGNPGAATLRIGPSESARSTASVPVRTLSDVVAGAGFGARALVVKIDVEGAELEVLSGADECFSECPPSVILVECMDHHLRRFGATSLDLLGTLDALGYRLSSLHHGRRIDFEPLRSVNADIVAWRPDQSPW